ncbi:sensor histidine kinase [Parasulfuritortus cantonensis]|uniref:sensor histidine kinase n=1 Tax=Parasulfuritortus cantonensis TaxID=2528202 RepID=UPI00197F4264|nr:HAMP domain-containing sensor histidine kinase [Parasulfuritortus cantonensis]
MLISLLLGGAAARGWLLVEQFVRESRQGGEKSLQISKLTQELAARTVDIERNARQYRVLHDSHLLDRLDVNLSQSYATIERMQGLSGTSLAPLPADWRRASAELRDRLGRGIGEVDLIRLLMRLREVNESLGGWGKRWIDDQNATLFARLDVSGRHFAWQFLAAVSVSLAVTLVLGWWLGRPVLRLEQAIGRLGENRLDVPVVVRGPDDLNRLGRRLEWLRLRLAELEAGREQSLRHVSHELKTPLTALREGVALLQERVFGQLEGEQQEVVDILQHNVLQLQRQIESLLALNAVAHDAHRLRYRPVAVAEMVRAAVAQRDLQIQARNVTVTVDGDAGTAYLDEEKMLVVLDNLLSNALDFSPQGGTVRVVLGHDRGRVLIDVVDAGPGVDAEDAERIFMPFVRGRRSAPVPRQGSGVGLSIVQELVQAMAGRVELRASQRGAHFRVEVPDER